jgi:hypothetical protein
VGAGGKVSCAAQGGTFCGRTGNGSTTTHHGAPLVCRSIERNRRGPPSTGPRAHCGQDFGSESHVVNANERLQSEAGREHAQTELSCTTTSGIGQEAAGSDGQPPGKNEASDGAAEPRVTISAAELWERKELMFDAVQTARGMAFRCWWVGMNCPRIGRNCRVGSQARSGAVCIQAQTETPLLLWETLWLRAHNRLWNEEIT